MPQDRISGAQANEFGHGCAAKIAAALGAKKLSGRSNACEYQGRQITIHSAKGRNRKVGATHRTLDSVDAVWGAFELDGVFNVISLSAGEFKSNMEPTRSKGPSSGKVGIVSKNVFDRFGTIVGRVPV